MLISYYHYHTHSREHYDEKTIRRQR